jgi:hypothetical protein
MEIIRGEPNLISAAMPRQADRCRRIQTVAQRPPACKASATLRACTLDLQQRHSPHATMHRGISSNLHLESNLPACQDNFSLTRRAGSLAVRALTLAVLFVPTQPATAAPTWDDVAPLFSSRCTLCHSGEGAPNGLQLGSYATALKGGVNGPVFKPGAAAASELIKRLKGERQPRMPLTGPPLPERFRNLAGCRLDRRRRVAGQSARRAAARSTRCRRAQAGRAGDLD